MNEDWKEALSKLRGNLAISPENDTPNIEEEEVKSKYLQPQPLTVILDRKGRNGKTATIIEGFSIQKEEVAEIAKEIKQKLGTGGSIRDGEILIQGDYKEKIKMILSQLGFRIK